ncbi:MAG: hypothetical protein F6K10_14170, partial [Moorea sp. SIO2B7]|nr:hypothetical protein [Moorena sp. SIO2B7]
QAFADYYNKQVGQGLSYRIENMLDVIPNIPLPPPFPLNAVAGNGLKLGSFYLGNYVPVGELHTVFGLGSQNFAVDVPGLGFALGGGIPFPHGTDSYEMLLEEDRLNGQQAFAPVRNILGPFLKELLQEETQALQKDLRQLQIQVQALNNSDNGNQGSE